MVKSISFLSGSQPSIPLKNPKKGNNFRKSLIITVIVLEVFLLLGSIGLGVAAIASGVHLLWIGVIPCALAMISLVGGLLCFLKPSRRNNWAFPRIPHAPYPRAYLTNDYRRGVFRGSMSKWY